MGCVHPRDAGDGHGASNRDDHRQLFRPARRAHGRALPCVQLAVGTDVASTSPAPDWQRRVDGRSRSVKDRWVFPLAPDADRAQVLAVKDDSVNRRMPWAQYREPVWSRGSFRPHTGGGDYKQFAARAA